MSIKDDIRLLINDPQGIIYSDKIICGFINAASKKLNNDLEFKICYLAAANIAMMIGDIKAAKVWFSIAGYPVLEVKELETIDS